MNEPLRVLILEDNPNDATLIAHELRRSGLDALCTCVQDERRFCDEVKNFPDVILAGNCVGGLCATRALEILRQQGTDVPLIVFTSSTGEDVAVEALSHGASDYVLKDRMGRLRPAIENAVAQQRLRAERSNDGTAGLADRALAAIDQGIAISDARLPHNPVTFVNPGFERLTGYSSAEIIGQSSAVLHGERTDPQTIEQIRAAMDGGVPIAVEILQYRKDGTPFWNALTIAPIRDEAGNLTHFVGVHTDISDRKRQEVQCRQVQKMEAIGRLAGGVAHDFNNLLTVILGCSDLLLTSLPADSPLRELAQQVKQAGERGATLTRQLLAFSRQQKLEPQLLYLNDVIGDLSKMLRRLIGEDIEYITTLDPKLGLVKADPGQCEQVLLNLVVNARDAMPHGGRVTVETRNVELDETAARDRPGMPAGSYVMVEVRDTGRGMSADVMSHMYEPFFTTKEPGKGTGLGLATVYGIVKQSSGYVYADSRPGHGTVFQVYFPRIRSSETIEPHLAAHQPTPPGKETILLVEDEETVRRLNRIVLTSKGYTVLEASNGVEATGICEKHGGPIHLLVTDVIMPKMNCHELVNRVRSLRPATKVLFVSGYSADVLASQGLADSSSPMLQKPFSPAVLMRKVREVLETSSNRTVRML